jgi:hypothetical protein
MHAELRMLICDVSVGHVWGSSYKDGLTLQDTSISRWLVRRADQRKDMGTTHSARLTLPPHTPALVIRQLGLPRAVAP